MESLPILSPTGIQKAVSNIENNQAGFETEKSESQIDENDGVESSDDEKRVG